MKEGDGVVKNRVKASVKRSVKRREGEVNTGMDDDEERETLLSRTHASFFTLFFTLAFTLSFTLLFTAFSRCQQFNERA